MNRKINVILNTKLQHKYHTCYEHIWRIPSILHLRCAFKQMKALHAKNTRIELTRLIDKK